MIRCFGVERILYHGFPEHFVLTDKKSELNWTRYNFHTTECL